MLILELETRNPDGTFKTGKTTGRPKGSVNNKELKGKIKNLLTNYMNDDLLQKDWKALSPSERIKAVGFLSSYVITKKKEVHVDTLTQEDANEWLERYMEADE